YERLVLGLEARTRLRIGQGCFERGVKLVYIRVVASFLERTRECIDVGATRLINVGRKLRIDVEVVRVLVRRLATERARGVVVATRLRAHFIDRAACLVEERTFHVATHTIQVVELS